MALSNIQQVDNILNALTTSEEAAKKDLKELALPSYEILANSDLANSSLTKFYDEIGATPEDRRQSMRDDEHTSLRRLSHFMKRDDFNNYNKSGSKNKSNKGNNRVTNPSQKNLHYHGGQQKLLSPRQFNKQTARTLKDFRKITKTHGVQGVRRQQSPPQHWHNGLRSYDKHPEEHNFKLSARDVMHKTKYVQRWETKSARSKGPAPNGYNILGRETQMHRQSIEQEAMRKYQSKKKEEQQVEDILGDDEIIKNNKSNNNNDNKDPEAMTNLHIINGSLKQRFDNIKSKLNNGKVNKLRVGDDEERVLNEELMQLDQRLKFMKDKSPKSKRTLQKINENEKNVKKLLRDSKQSKKRENNTINRNKANGEEDEGEEYEPTFTELEPRQQQLYLMTLNPKQRELLMLTLNVETSKAINTAIADNYGNLSNGKNQLVPINDELHQAVRANWDKRQSVVDRNNNNDDNYNNNGNKTNENKDDDVGVAPPVIPPIIVDTSENVKTRHTKNPSIPSIPPPAPPTPPLTPTVENDTNKEDDVPPPIPPFVEPPSPMINADSSDPSDDSDFSEDDDDDNDSVMTSPALPPGTPNSVDSDIPPPPMAPPPPLNI